MANRVYVRSNSRGVMQDLKSLYRLINNAKKNIADGKDLTQALGRFQLRFGHRAWGIGNASSCHEFGWKQALNALQPRHTFKEPARNPTLESILKLQPIPSCEDFPWTWFSLPVTDTPIQLVLSSQSPPVSTAHSHLSRHVQPVRRHSRNMTYLKTFRSHSSSLLQSPSPKPAMRPYKTTVRYAKNSSNGG